MPTLVVFHEVDDVDHWLASPKRDEFFGPQGMSARTFRDPSGSNRVGLIVEVPSLEAWEQALQSPEAAEAMKYGASDYILKPFDPGELLDLIQKALASRRLVSATTEVGPDTTAQNPIDGLDRSSWDFQLG